MREEPTVARRVRLIACEIAYRECCYAAALSPNIVDVHFMTQGLHDLASEAMCARIQAEVDAAPEGRYDAIALGFGLCNNGVAGLCARHTPLVLPRAHDCITFFLGSKEAYRETFTRNPGVYYLTTGWIERDGENIEDTRGDAGHLPTMMGLSQPMEELVAQYGEENARMIAETLGDMAHYDRLCHIEMGVAPEAERRAADSGRAEADRRGWTFESRPGRLELLRALADGPWDDDRFLTVAPGHRIAPTHDERIVRAEAPRDTDPTD